MSGISIGFVAYFAKTKAALLGGYIFFNQVREIIFILLDSYHFSCYLTFSAFFFFILYAVAFTKFCSVKT